MAKRFCDTDLWKKQRWFRRLKPEYKLAFCYIRDECNHAGCWKIDCSDLIDDLGFETFDISDFVKTINIDYDKVSGNKIEKERLRILKNNYLWITGFIQFQYEGKDKKISWKVPAARTALMFLDGMDLLLETVNKGYITLREPLSDGWETVKDKDKDKDKKGGTGENKKQKGERFDEEFKTVIFPDGKTQMLGSQQRDLAKDGRLNANSIIQGAIY